MGEGHAAFTADLTSAKETDELIRAVNARFGRIDIVVNNAGMVQQGTEFKSSRIEKITDEDWQRHLALNVTTAFNVIRAVLPLMQKREFGRIVNVSSVTGPLVVNPRSAGYSSAKAAMTGLTRTTAIENASRNITCNAVLPGWIETASSKKRGNSGRQSHAYEKAGLCLRSGRGLPVPGQRRGKLHQRRHARGRWWKFHR